MPLILALEGLYEANLVYREFHDSQELYSENSVLKNQNLPQTNRQQQQQQKTTHTHKTRLIIIKESNSGAAAMVQQVRP
jgi:heme oxygenase